jgi:hypothetical protein
MQRKTKLLVSALGVIAMVSVVYATMLASFTTHNNVNVVSAPGIQACNADGSPCTSLNWGDLALTTSLTHVVFIKNVGGCDVWILVSNSLKTSNLPDGLTLTWNLAGDVELTPGQQTTNIQLTLSASATAATGSVQFDTIFNGYSSQSG